MKEEKLILKGIKNNKITDNIWRMIVIENSLDSKFIEKLFCKP